MAMCSTQPTKQLQLVPFYRYCNGKEHFYTTNAHEIGTDVTGVTGRYGFKSEGIAGYISAVKQANLIPLYRYFNGKEHFYTTNAHEIGTDVTGVTGKHGYKSEGIAGYVSSLQGVNMIPFYRYFNGKEHFYTSNTQEIGTITPGLKGHYGYTSEGIACYVFSSK
eukprot:433277_1